MSGMDDCGDDTRYNKTSQDGMNVREGVNSFGGGVFRVYQLTMAMTLCFKLKLGAVLHSCFS